MQVVLDEALLQATDRAARRLKQTRSALVREALRQHLKRLDLLANEARDRDGYERVPDGGHFASVWEAEAAWPPL